MPKTFNKTSKKTPKPATKPEDTAFLIREDLDEQPQERNGAS